MLTACVLIFAYRIIFVNQYIPQKENSKTSRHWNLPYLIDHFVERKEMTEQIWNSLTQEEQSKKKLVIVGLGLGGAGKNRGPF